MCDLIEELNPQYGQSHVDVRARLNIRWQLMHVVILTPYGSVGCVSLVTVTPGCGISTAHWPA